MLSVSAAQAVDVLLLPFPDRLSAFVWRNWDTVPAAELACVTGTTEEKVNALAAEMGLAKQEGIDPRWKTVGRETIVRHNWNLVPEAQWKQLIDAEYDRVHCADSGYRKAHFGPPAELAKDALRWDDAVVAAGRDARRKLAKIAADADCAALAKGWRPFAFLDELKTTTGEKSAVAEVGRRFSLRMNLAYADEISDGLLEKNAACGVNALVLVADFATAADNCAEWRELVRRAGRFRIKIFLYLNEPRRRGGPETYCTSLPGVLEQVEERTREIFAAVPGLGGFVSITASEAKTNCASRRSQRGLCERCRGRRAGEIFAEVHSAMSRGMHRAEPDAFAICWDWGWNEDEAVDAIPLLPKGDGFMAMSEKGLETVTGGVTNEVREYAISRLGPSARALREWKAAKAAGLRPLAKVQTSASWEFSAVPEIHAFSLVKEHARRIAATEAEGVMLSWTVGSYPGRDMRLFTDYPHAVIDGTGDTSGAMKLFPYNGGTLYCGNQHVGAGNPLYPRPTGRLATMTGIPYDNLDRWRGNIPAEVWIEAMSAVGEKAPGLMGVHFRSAADQARFVLARDRGDTDGMRRIAEREIVTVREAAALLVADSRNAFESSNAYYYTPQDLREKLLGAAAFCGGGFTTTDLNKGN